MSCPPLTSTREAQTIEPIEVQAIEVHATLARFRRSSTRELRLELCSRDGHTYLDIRRWELQRDGSWVHGRGAAIHPHELKATRDALDRAIEQLDLTQSNPAGFPAETDPRMPRALPTLRANFSIERTEQ